MHDTHHGVQHLTLDFTIFYTHKCVMPKRPKFVHPIRIIRTTLGMTQPRFAVKVGCSGSAINQIENGQKAMSRELAHRIAFFSGADFLELMKGRGGRAKSALDGSPYSKESYDAWNKKYETSSVGNYNACAWFEMVSGWLQILFLAADRKKPSRLPVVLGSFAYWLHTVRGEFGLETQIDEVLEDIQKAAPDKYNAWAIAALHRARKWKPGGAKLPALPAWNPYQEAPDWKLLAKHELELLSRKVSERDRKRIERVRPPFLKANFWVKPPSSTSKSSYSRKRG